MGSSLHNSVGIGYNFYYLFLFLLVLFIFEISPRNKLQPPTDTQSPHSGRKSTMSTASFLTFATLLVLMTLSWSQPGEAALRTSDHGDPERATGQYMGHQIRKPGPCADRCAGNYRVRGNIAQKQCIKRCRKCKGNCKRVNRSNIFYKKPCKEECPNYARVCNMECNRFKICSRKCW